MTLAIAFGCDKPTNVSPAQICGQNADKLKILSATVTDIALISALVVGILGICNVIQLPPAAYYSMTAAGGITLLADIALLISKCAKHSRSNYEKV